MEEKDETVKGPMLKEKRQQFEDKFNIPEDDQLISDGWIAPFCKMYKLKEYHQHGETGSVDLEAVEVERKWLQGVLASYAKKDCFNFDETGLFALWVTRIFMKQ